MLTLGTGHGVAWSRSKCIDELLRHEISVNETGTVSGLELGHNSATYKLQMRKLVPYVPSIIIPRE